VIYEFVVLVGFLPRGPPKARLAQEVLSLRAPFSAQPLPRGLMQGDDGNLATPPEESKGLSPTLFSLGFAPRWAPGFGWGAVFVFPLYVCLPRRQTPPQVVAPPRRGSSRKPKQRYPNFRSSLLVEFFLIKPPPVVFFFFFFFFFLGLIFSVKVFFFEDVPGRGLLFVSCKGLYFFLPAQRPQAFGFSFRR